MKLLSLLALSAAVNAKSILRKEPNQDQVPLNGNNGLNVPATELFLVELGPGRTAWLTEEEKWELRRQGRNFMDITENQETYPAIQLQATSKTRYPSAPNFNSTVRSLIEDLSKDNMHKNLETFTSFHTRYYKSRWGADSSNWLYGQVKDVVEMSGAAENGAAVRKFKHTWGQNSVIATIPGQSNKTVVIGAHQDSINLFLPSFLAAPGADDDGSGTVTILEALRALLRSDDVVAGSAPNTIEFQWYSAEEGGLLGSQAIFKDYASRAVDVKAMLQQDMTGYTQKTLDAGEPESVGVITDFVDPDLTDFIRKTITTYCDIPYIETKCGYACSDHASASKYGYPSAFVIESDFKYSDTKIHTTEDKIEFLDFDHMLQHARMTLAFAFEMAFAEL